MDVDTGEGFAHPLMRWLAGVGEQFDGAVECPTLSLPLDQYEGAMRQLAMCEAKLASLRLSLTRQAELNEVRKFTGAANTAGWVQQHTRMGRREASVSVRLYFCHFPDCRGPEKWTEAHHIRHWVDGGATDLYNGVLLCQHHHTAIHAKGWTVRMSDDGHPEYVPPPWVDPYQDVIRPSRPTLRR
jgi:hypothetical protein